MNAKTASHTATASILAHRLQALGQKYASQLPVKIAEIKSNWNAVRLDRGNIAALENLYQLVHGLAGSGATFGFPKFSIAAQQVERFLDPGGEYAGLDLNDGESGIVNLVGALESTVAESEPRRTCP